jgi:hypothetical protein
MRVALGSILGGVITFTTSSFVLADEFDDAKKLCNLDKYKTSTSCSLFRKQQEAYRKAAVQVRQITAAEETNRVGTLPSAAVNGAIVPGGQQAPPPRPGEQSCVPLANSIFVRADPLDNFHYLLVPTTSSSSDEKGGSNAGAKGASISYTDNSGTQTASVNGRLSYLAFSQYCGVPYGERDVTYIHAFGIAPFIDANGTWNDPVKKGTNSAVQAGVDLVVALDFPSSTLPIPATQYIYLSPFHETDFANVADINGAVLAWEPQNIDWALGVATKGNNPYYNFFWQFRAQASWSDVSNVGYTNLTLGNHGFLGDIVRANLAILPSSPNNNLFPEWVNQWIVGRFSLIGTMQDFRDVIVAKNYDYYSATLQYKLGACTTQSNSGDGAAAKPAAADSEPCKINGSSSISFEYISGTDMNTLVKANQYLVKFSYAY